MAKKFKSTARKRIPSKKNPTFQPSKPARTVRTAVISSPGQRTETPAVHHDEDTPVESAQVDIELTTEESAPVEPKNEVTPGPVPSRDVLGRFAKNKLALFVLIPLLGALCGAAAGYLYSVKKPVQYGATQIVLVQPAPYGTYRTASEVGALVGSDSARLALQTASGLLSGVEVEEKTAANFQRGTTSAFIRSRVRVVQQGESNLLGITAIYETPEGASKLAETYAQVAVTLHSDRVRSNAQAMLQTSAGRAEAEIAELNHWSAQGDGGIRQVSSAATAPWQIGFPQKTVISSGFIMGLSLALLIVFAVTRRSINLRVRHDK